MLASGSRRRQIKAFKFVYIILQSLLPGGEGLGGVPFKSSTLSLSETRKGNLKYLVPDQIGPKSVKRLVHNHIRGKNSSFTDLTFSISFNPLEILEDNFLVKLKLKLFLCRRVSQMCIFGFNNDKLKCSNNLK